MVNSPAFTAFAAPASRLGFHYFPDTLHYRAADLQTWLPVLQEMGAGWLVLRSELGRAIPEHFLLGLRQGMIEPLVRFELPLDRLPDGKELGTLLEVYARWGARCVLFYDRPNDRTSWPAAGWAQQDLVERFLDRWLPAATLARQVGLTPVFPPLEPGGSYWDTAFLRSAFQALLRRRQDALLQNLCLAAYGWTSGRSLNWGAGGPERWPLARPYLVTPGTQDQRGFRIFDWYLAVARSVLGQPLPLILFQASLPGDPRRPAPRQTGSLAPASSADEALAVARLLAGEAVTDPRDPANALDPIPKEVRAACFWLLSAPADSPAASQAWFDENGQPRKDQPGQDLRRLALARQKLPPAPASGIEQPVPLPAVPAHPIQHYLLLPGYEWGVPDWYLEVVRPFVKKYRPTVGFSPVEAERATRVTVVGNPNNFPPDLLERLQKAGCEVEQISGDGTFIATELAER